MNDLIIKLIEKYGEKHLDNFQLTALVKTVVDAVEESLDLQDDREEYVHAEKGQFCWACAARGGNTQKFLIKEDFRNFRGV